MSQDDVRNICIWSFDSLVANFAQTNCSCLQCLNFDNGSQHCSKALKIIDSDFRQRPDTSVVIPSGPSGTSVAVKSTRTVDGTDFTIVQMSSERSKGWRKLNKRCAQ